MLTRDPGRHEYAGLPLAKEPLRWQIVSTPFGIAESLQVKTSWFGSPELQPMSAEAREATGTRNQVRFMTISSFYLPSPTSLQQ
jgi:hypothetical protein